MDRAQKATAIEEIKGRFGRMTSAVFVNFKGLTVESATKLRADFRKAGVEYKVVKNTLAKQAVKGEAYSDNLSKLLVGMTGIAWSYEDPSAAAKVVKEFRKDPVQAERVQVKGAVIDGQILDTQGVETNLASLPSKNELRAQLLGVFEAPAVAIVSILQAPAQEVVGVLQAKADKDKG